MSNKNVPPTNHIPRQFGGEQYPPQADVGYGGPAPEQPKKKSHRGLWVLLIVAAIVVVGIIVSSGGDDSTSVAAGIDAAPTSGASPTAQDDPLEDGGWVASDIQVKREQFGTSITARIQNTEDHSRTGVFTLTVFSGGQRIYEAMGSANDVEAGSTATVTFVGTTDDLDGDVASYTYELQNDM